MKAILRTACSIFLALIYAQGYTQCTQAQMNWDNLDFYYSSGGLKPYGSFVSVTQAQTQKFAIGTTYATIVTPAVSTFIIGENATHTGNVTVDGVAYTGEDVQFIPSANGERITISFGVEVEDVRFTLYDIDASSDIYVTATDAFSIPKILNATFQTPTVLSTNILVSGVWTPSNNTSNLRLVATTGTDHPNSVNDATATIFISGRVKEITLDIQNISSDPNFWMSDITACVFGSFPNNYHQMAINRPYTGQPAYFLGTPDNQYAFMIGLDPTQATATANYRVTSLFGDSIRYVNSFAYDAANQLLYYVIDGTGAANSMNNKQLKRYDFNTETSATVIGNLTATLGIVCFEQGVESAGASFYDGALYLGIEGGRHNDGTTASPAYSSTRETIIYKIEFDAGRNPVHAYQVWAKATYDATGATSQHDWGDFLVKDGILYNFNTTQTTANAAVHKVDLMTGQMTTLANPNPSSPYVGQVGLDWPGNMYSVRDRVYPFNTTTGALGTGKIFVVSSGSQTFPITGGVGDASEPFRPKVDLGDAPATYDPDPLAPAVHDYTADTRVRLGTNLDREWTKTASSNADGDGADEDGVGTVFLYNNGTNYVMTVNVMNNQVVNNSTTNVATLCAWFDSNMNGVFETTEGISRSIAKSASMQAISLSWSTAGSTVPDNSMTYVRIRIASNNPDASKNLTTAKPTGYMPNGEVEDYYVLTSTWLLPLTGMEFTVEKEEAKVALHWNFEEDAKIRKYIITRSSDAVNFTPVMEVNSNGGKRYKAVDRAPLMGKSYYRLEVIDVEGKKQLGLIRSVDFKPSPLAFSLQPNPTAGPTQIRLYSQAGGIGIITVFNATGLPVHNQAAALQPGQNKVVLDAAHLPAGAYVVQVQNQRLMEQQKLIIKK